MRRRSLAITVAVAAIMVVLAVIFLRPHRFHSPQNQLVTAAPLPGGPHAMPAAAASPADDGNWVMPGKDYASSRFSALTEVTPANVGKLQVAFTFSTGTTE